MTFKTLTVILCSLVILCSRKIEVEATVLTTHLNPVTWETARERCALNSETFATPRLSRTGGSFIVNDADLKLDSNQTLWVGHVQQFNYFMFKGCVSESTFTHSISTRNLVMCYNYCNTSYVGFRKRGRVWECECINSTPNWNTLVDCFDHNIMIFEHVDIEPLSFKTESVLKDEPMCGRIWVQANTTREFKLISCDSASQTWCEKNSTISMEEKCNSVEKKWTESVQCCTASRLPQLTPNTMTDITFNISKTTKTFIWTALLRQWIVIDHNRLQGVLHPESKCAYVMKGASGKIELHFDNCTTNRMYMCSGPTTEGASPTTSVVTSISTSSLSSTLSSSMSTEGITDIISCATGKDEEDTRTWVPLVAGISGAVVGLLVIIIVVFLYWKRRSKRRTTVATTDQVVHGQEGSLPLNDTVHTYEGLIGASVMPRTDPNNYDVLDVGTDDTEHTYEGVIGASVMTRPDPNNYDVLDVGTDDTEHTYEAVIGASVMIIPDSNNYVDMNAGIHM